MLRFSLQIPLKIINFGINPIAYALFKRDIKQECKRLLLRRRTLFNHRIISMKEKHLLMHILKTILDPEDFRFRIYP